MQARLKQHWQPRLIGLLLVIGALCIQILVPHRAHDHTWLARVDALWYDLRFEMLAPERALRMPIVIIDLDEQSLQREGRWPWDRAKVAQLVQQLKAAGIGLIGFDVVFSEPGPNPAAAISKYLLSQELALAQEKNWNELLDQVGDELDGDQQLAAELGADTVLGFFLHNDGADAGQLPPAPLLLDLDSPQPELLTMANATANIPALNRNFPAQGFVVAIPDGDGVVRRMPLVMQHQDGLYHALSLEIVRLALGAPWSRLRTTTEESQSPILTSLHIGNALEIPVDPQGQLLVPYRGGAGSFPTLSATQVLRDELSTTQRKTLAGAIALIGTSALGLADLRTTPLQTSYPGVEVHANLIDAMLYAAWLKEQGENPANAFYLSPDWEQGAVLLQIIIFGILLSVGLPGRTPRQMFSLALACLILIIGLNLGLWHYAHLALHVALILLTALAITGFNVIYGYYSTARQKQQIQNLFGEYVPPEHVRFMLSRPDAISLEGEQKAMSVLFADVRNFTAISEGLSPAELKSTLNRYLSAVTEVIFAHQGTIDKYVGDLIMAFWNAPLDDPNHAEHAVQAALAMQKRLVALRAEFAKEGLPQFHVGIGINTGSMNVGDMGSAYRRAYTVLGDAVNLAARLESLTSFYQLPILLSDTTRQAAPDFVYRTVDYVRVKGRKQPLYISQPLAPTGTLSAQEQAFYRASDQALQQYQQGCFEDARQTFVQLTKQAPNDPLLALYLQRLDAQRTHPEAWQPIFDHEQK